MLQKGNTKICNNELQGATIQYQTHKNELHVCISLVYPTNCHNITLSNCNVIKPLHFLARWFCDYFYDARFIALRNVHEKMSSMPKENQTSLMRSTASLTEHSNVMICNYQIIMMEIVGSIIFIPVVLSNMQPLIEGWLVRRHISTIFHERFLWGSK